LPKIISGIKRIAGQMDVCHLVQKDPEDIGVQPVKDQAETL
jgi:hypothetical protein